MAYLTGAVRAQNGVRDELSRLGISYTEDGEEAFHQEDNPSRDLRVQHAVL
jgi:hypothetical protein